MLLHALHIFGVDQRHPTGHVVGMLGQQAVLVIAQHFGPDVIDCDLHDLMLVVDDAVIQAQVRAAQGQRQTFFAACHQLLGFLTLRDVVDP